MLIVHVDIQVLAGAAERFVSATRENARASRQEPGVASFDLIRRQDDPDRFLLIEVYRDAEAPALHKATDHYRVWAETVAPMMARPRQSLKYSPTDQDLEVGRS